MALAYRTSAAAGNVISGTDPSVAITPANGDLLFVFCTANGNTNAAPTCSDGNTGGTYSLLFTALKNSSTDIISCFVRNAVVPNTTSTTVTVAIGAHTATEIVVVAVSGATAAGTAAVVQTATQANQAAATTPAPVFAATTALQNLCLGIIGNGTNPAGTTTPSGWTRQQNVGQTACGLSVHTRDSGFNGTTVTFGGTSASAFASGVVEVQLGPANAGVNVSKVNAYAVLAPPAGVAVSKLVAYAVLGPTIVAPPIWPSMTFADGTVGVAYSVDFDLTPAAAPVTYSVVSGALPTGLSLSSVALDVGRISGTPTVAGVYSFTLRASNAYGTADHAFSITIYTAPVGTSGNFGYTA